MINSFKFKKINNRVLGRGHAVSFREDHKLITQCQVEMTKIAKFS